MTNPSPTVIKDLIWSGKAVDAEKSIQALAHVQGDHKAMELVQSLDRDSVFMMCKGTDESTSTITPHLLSNSQKLEWLNDLWDDFYRKVIDKKAGCSDHYALVLSPFSHSLCASDEIDGISEFLDYVEEVEGSLRKDSMILKIGSVSEVVAVLSCVYWESWLSEFHSETGTDISLEEFIENPDVLSFHDMFELVDSGFFHNEGYFFYWISAFLQRCNEHGWSSMLKDSVKIWLDLLRLSGESI